jgi:hypothetical protein
MSRDLILNEPFCDFLEKLALTAIRFAAKVDHFLIGWPPRLILRYLESMLEDQPGGDVDAERNVIHRFTAIPNELGESLVKCVFRYFHHRSLAEPHKFYEEHYHRVAI